jgi:hypothetical protein
MVRIGDVWDRTTEFLSDQLRAILPIAVLAVLVPTSITNSLSDLQQSGPAGTRALLGVLSLVFGLLSLWAQLAIASLAIDGVGARRATERFLPAVGVFLLLGLAFALVAAVLIVPTMLIGGFDFSQLRLGQTSMQPLSLPAGYRLGLVLAALLLFVLFIALAARLAPLTAVILNERRGVGAIGRAFGLTRGLTWKLIGVIILFAIVSTVSQWAAQAVFGSVLALIAGGEGPVTLAKVLTGAIIAAVQTAFTVIAAAFTAKLYLASVARDGARGGGVPLSKPA